MPAPPPTNDFELPFTVENLEVQFNWTTDYAAYIWWSIYTILNAPQATAADVISEDLNWLFLSESVRIQPRFLSWRKWVWLPPNSNSDGDLNLTAALVFTKTHRTTSTWDITLAHEENWINIARAEGARDVTEWMDYLKISSQRLPVLGLAAHDCRVRVAENLNEFIQGGTRRRARLQHIPWTAATCYLSIVTGSTPRDTAVAAMQAIHEPWNDSEAGAIDRDEDISFGEAQQAFFELVLTALPMIFNEYETNPRVDRPTPSARIQATLNYCRRLVSDSARESAGRDGPWNIGLSPANVMWTAYTTTEIEQLQDRLAALWRGRITTSPSNPPNPGMRSLRWRVQVRDAANLTDENRVDIVVDADDSTHALLIAVLEAERRHGYRMPFPVGAERSAYV